jgi:hypothetical protein
MIKQGKLVYSPIAHGYGLAQYGNLGGDFEQWKDHTKAMLSRADELIVVKLPGWMDSQGIREEVKLASLFDVPVTYMSLQTATALLQAQDEQVAAELASNSESKLSIADLVKDDKGDGLYMCLSDPTLQHLDRCMQVIGPLTSWNATHFGTFKAGYLVKDGVGDFLIFDNTPRGMYWDGVIWGTYDIVTKSYLCSSKEYENVDFTLIRPGDVTLSQLQNEEHVFPVFYIREETLPANLEEPNPGVGLFDLMCELAKASRLDIHPSSTIVEFLGCEFTLNAVGALSMVVSVAYTDKDGTEYEEELVYEDAGAVLTHALVNKLKRLEKLEG